MCYTYVLEVTNVCEDCIRVVYSTESPGIPSEIKTEWFSTRARGNWDHINFMIEDGISLENFLECMTVNNTEVLRKICLLLLDKIEYDYWKYLHIIPILDPTFVPPQINKECRWQKELANSIVNEHFRGVISTCMTTNRLKKLTHILKYQNHKYNH